MKIIEALKMCLNYKVLLGILAVIALAYLFVPKFAGLAPYLLVLICPLSMVLMMAGMKHGDKNNQNKKTETIDKV